MYFLLTQTMQELLIKEIRRGDPSVHASLSPCDGHSYFLKIGSSVLYMHDSDTLQSALDWANGLPMPDSDTVVLTLTPPNSRPQSPSNC